jgi:hypothetical protein
MPRSAAVIAPTVGDRMLGAGIASANVALTRAFIATAAGITPVAAAMTIAVRRVPIITAAIVADASMLAVVAITIVAMLRPNIIAVAVTIAAALARRATIIVVIAAAAATAKITAVTATVITVAVIAHKKCGSHFLQPSPKGREDFAALFVAGVTNPYFTISRTGQVHWPSS